MKFEDVSLWEHLKSTDKPILMYGTGNGADKIISALEKYGISLSGIFASDGFVRDRYFYGFHVLSYSEVIKKFGQNIVVLLAFGTTRPEVINFIHELDKNHELIIPDVPLYGGELFDMPYFLKHRSQFDTVYSLLNDEKSKDVFSDAINFRLSGKLKYLSNTSTFADSVKELLSDFNISSAIDGGAFSGDTTRDIIGCLFPKRVYSVEADPKTYKKLKEYSETEKRASVIPQFAALGAENGCKIYISSGSRGAGISGANKRSKECIVPCRTIDSLCSAEKIDLIKLDIEGDENAALDGALSVIKRDEPNMIVSLYHRTDDLFRLILRLHELLPRHRLYVRRVPCVPMWDLSLFAIK